MKMNTAWQVQVAGSTVYLLWMWRVPISVGLWILREPNSNWAYERCAKMGGEINWAEMGLGPFWSMARSTVKAQLTLTFLSFLHLFLLLTRSFLSFSFICFSSLLHLLSSSQFFHSFLSSVSYFSSLLSGPCIIFFLHLFFGFIFRYLLSSVHLLFLLLPRQCGLG
jgi:hypothetical protein